MVKLDRVVWIRRTICICCKWGKPLVCPFIEAERDAGVCEYQKDLYATIMLADARERALKERGDSKAE